MIGSESVEQIINAHQDESISGNIEKENDLNKTQEIGNIIVTSKQPKKAKFDITSSDCESKNVNNSFIADYMKSHRININIRQVNNL